MRCKIFMLVLLTIILSSFVSADVQDSPVGGQTWYNFSDTFDL